MSKDRQGFYDASLQYVFKIQEVQERKKFEFVEPVSSCTKLLLVHCSTKLGFITADTIDGSVSCTAAQIVTALVCVWTRL